MALLWQEYAKADYRWGFGDETIVSLELITVLIYGPMTAWICWMIVQEQDEYWYWIVVVAVGELYGGMSFPFIFCFLSRLSLFFLPFFLSFLFHIARTTLPSPRPAEPKKSSLKK